MIRIILVALLLTGAARAGELTVELDGGTRSALTLATAADDADLANPAGYFAAEPPAAKVVERIEIENVGSEPIRDPDLRVNHRPLLPTGDLLMLLDLPPRATLLELYEHWRARRIHGSSGLAACRDAGEVLRTLGATYCGDEAPAFAALALRIGAEVRQVPVTGHVVGEYRVGDGDWAVFDTDQNAFYLRWDNRTPASAADLRADPLLVFRTKIYGRQARWEPGAAWLNTARFERAGPERNAGPFRVVTPSTAPGWELWPGERVVIHPHRHPRQVLARTADRARETKLRRAAVRVDYVVSKARPLPARAPFAVFRDVGAEPAYEVSAPGRVSGQIAARLTPWLHRGRNEVAFAGAGRVRIRFVTRDGAPPPPPAPGVRVVESGRPRFALTVTGEPDALWWQIGLDEQFRLVPPNFDQVGRFATEFEPSGALDGTFLDPDRPAFVRARIRLRGAWSAWSDPLPFVVGKPPRPAGAHVEVTASRARVRWTPAAGTMLVFGSDRLDFVPEIHGLPEAVRLHHGALRETRPARNLLAEVDGRAGEATVPLRAAYRLVAQDADGRCSVPSGLLRLGGRPALVLQNEHLPALSGGGREDVTREVAVAD